MLLIILIVRQMVIKKKKVHGKTTYEWYTNDMRVHNSDKQMTYEYIRVTYG